MTRVLSQTYHCMSYGILQELTLFIEDLIPVQLIKIEGLEEGRLQTS